MGVIQDCLIIDDDKDDQEIFVMCANKVSPDIRCSTADDGVEAVALLQSNKNYIPRYIFIDVNMPKMNGIECLSILKNMERLKYSKIFMYSTTSESGTLESSRLLGADEFIIKPSKSAELKEKLSKIFGIVSRINS
jgi:CheY-like chemotaxis protein